jgi:hypothetical protein
MLPLDFVIILSPKYFHRIPSYGLVRRPLTRWGTIIPVGALGSTWGLSNFLVSPSERPGVLKPIDLLSTFTSSE